MCRILCLIVALSTATACATAGTKDPAEEGPDADVPDLPDARPTPDAPAPPDAPCSNVVQELLLNPGFDNGADGNWQKQSPYDLITPAADLPIPPHSGNYVAWLGGFNNLSETLWQQVDVPAGTVNLEISGYLWIRSNEPGGPIDGAVATLRSPVGAELETVGTWSNADAGATWVPFSYTALDSYAGQSIRLQVDSATDSAYVTDFFVDTLSVEATVCQ